MKRLTAKEILAASFRALYCRKAFEMGQALAAE